MSLFRRASKVISSNPTVDTAAYASGDVLFAVTTLTDAVLDTGGVCKLESVVLSDLANQKQAIDLVFFDQAPVTSIGALNAAYGLADADAPKLIGRVSIGTSDYVSSGSNNAEATKTSLGLLLKALAGSKSIYVAGICRSGTPTYAASDIWIRFGFSQD